jgi:protein-disulfide isomerase
MTTQFEKLLTTVLALSALGVAASAVRGSFFPVSQAASQQRQAPDFIDYWEDAVSIGYPAGGDPSAPITIVTLVDFECPACAGFNAILSEALEEYSKEVRSVYVSYPLRYHKFALGAARGADCADRVGAFREWAQVLYGKQDSLGLKPWSAYAAEAGISDTAQIGRCAVNPESVPRIEAGLKFGSRIQVASLPTVLVNGWRYRGTPTKGALDTVITALLRGERPR